MKIRGFTLIELLVSIMGLGVIVMVVVGIGALIHFIAKVW